MLATIHSAALYGIDAFSVRVEVDVAGGRLPGYHVVGLPTAGVREAAVRIRSALEHIGQALPRKKITVNLAPADRRKEGGAFDLPIALAVLVAEGRIPADRVRDLLVLGELGLDGSVRAVKGGLSCAMLAQRKKLRGVMFPREAAQEAAEVLGLAVLSVSHLAHAVEYARGNPTEVTRPRGVKRQPSTTGPDMSDVRGQQAARAALEVAVSGGHNLLFVGPPGIGKTMLARRIPSILPPLSKEEALETTRIYSASGRSTGGLVTQRPFRAPHHSISPAALIGGGNPPHAGEISLAHNGVLFLDELPEFPRGVLESLRQPLEDRSVTIGRVSATITLPASVVLAASANPCPCGWFGASERSCTCSPRAVERYRARLSGPLLDRIDLQVYVPTVDLETLRSRDPSESSSAIRPRVASARARQLQRLRSHGLRTNAEMSARVIRSTCRLSASAEGTLRTIYKKSGWLTARGVDRLIKVARTIADMNELDDIDSGSLLEATHYRSLDTEPSLDPRQLVATPAGPTPSDPRLGVSGRSLTDKSAGKSPISPRGPNR